MGVRTSSEEKFLAAGLALKKYLRGLTLEQKRDAWWLNSAKMRFELH